MKRITETQFCVGLFVVSIALHLSFSAVGLHHSLIEVHQFRQVQTALTARSLQEEGWSMAYLTPLFGPPWSVPMEFPLFQLIVAKLASLTGMPLELTGRVTAIAFLYLSLPAILGLARCLGLDRNRRWLLPAAVLLTPVYLYYSRAFMIESTALCTSTWFLLGYIRAVSTHSRRWLVVAVICGMLAALVKVTTFGVFLAVAGVYTLALLIERRQTAGAWLRTSMLAVIGIGPAIFAGTWWVHFSDSVKASNPLTVHLISSNLSAFNFGSVAQRFSLEFWKRISLHTQVAVAPVLNLTLIALFTLLLARANRLRGCAVLLGFAVGPLVFANLYFVHDYYFYANGLFLLGALVLAWDEVLSFDGVSRWARWTVILVSAAAQLGTYLPEYFQVQRKALGPIPEIGSILAAATLPGDIVLMFGNDWEAHAAYYSHRRAIMIPDSQLPHPENVNAVLDRIAPGQVTALVASGPIRKYPDSLRPYIERLHLRSNPILLNSDTAIYLAETRVSNALSRLESNPPTTFAFAAPSVDATSSIPRMRALGPGVEEKLFAMMSPSPVEIMYPFGLGLHVVNGRDAFNAHAPTDLIFRVPQGATTVVAKFGIADAAFTGKNHTEGVEFRVELVTSDGAHHTLQSAYLSPNERSSDAGEKTMTFALPSDSSGEVWFRTLPGHTGSIAFAWAYWSKIEMR
ncbi:MAG: hypothetical protein ABIV50_12000 [Opitutus sp.]